MAKTLADIGTKIDIVDGTEETTKGRGWKFWVFTPLALLTVASVAFLAVRRFMGGSAE